MRVGSGDFVYEEDEIWGELPVDWTLGDIPGVAVDAHDRVYLFCRGEHPVVVLDRDGHFLDTWGQGLFTRPHGIFIGPDDAVYCVDDEGHAVHKFTADGTALLTIACPDGPSDTGCTVPGGTVLRAGPPFNLPTGLALSPRGDMYVSDGYGNARVHTFDRDGRLQFSWGEPGTEPGQFMLPHGVLVDPEGRVYVADRRNDRIQIFSPRGEFLDQWTEVRRPDNMCLDADGYMYVAELGMVMQGEAGRKVVVRTAAPGRITVRDRTGAVLAEWGARDPEGAGLYCAPHGIAIDSHGDIYMSEVATANSGGLAAPDHRVIHKYVRV